MSSLLLKLLELLVHGPSSVANSATQILDYGDESTFCNLWKNGLNNGKLVVSEQKLDLTNSSQSILLVGNDPPSEIFNTVPPSLRGINLRGHFTATSWLAAWRLRYPDSPVRIAVIDPRQRKLTTGPAKPLQSLLGATVQDGTSLVPGATVLNAPSLETICRWLSQTESRIASQDSPEILDLLRSTIWNELTSDRDRHHALSNVAGSLLLVAQVGTRSASEKLLQSYQSRFPIQPYLLALAQSCGISAAASRESADPGSGERPPDWWIGKRLNEAIPNAVLIDDLCDLWSLFLQVALGFCGSEAEVNRLITSPPGGFESQMKDLPERLQAVIRDPQRSLNSGDLIPGDRESTEDFVLFLDLRLGLGDEFQRQLEQVGLELLSSDRKLPWLTDEARSAFKSELEAGGTDETLLPRLIALLDPTLPVIIFSSTHRRELIEPFRDYGNLVTTFRKPVLTGMTEDWAEAVSDIHASFVNAVEEAVRILRMLGRVSSLRDAIPRRQPSQQAPAGRLVEIYFDESGYPVQRGKDPPRFGVGGLYVIHPDQRASDQFHQIVDENVTWGVSDNCSLKREDLLRRKIVKKEPSNAQRLYCYERVQEAAEECGTMIGGFSLSAKTQAPNRDAPRELSQLLDPLALDNLYLRLLSECLEILLFHCPHIELEADTIEIFAADRQAPAPGGPPELKSWRDAYGIQITSGGYRSMPFDGVFRMLPPLLNRYHVNYEDVNIRRALAVKLEYLENISDREKKIKKLEGELEEGITTKESNLENTLGQLRSAQEAALKPLGTKQAPKQVHYLADWLAKVGKFNELKRMQVPVSDWFLQGFAQDYSLTLMQQLESCRSRNPLDAIQGWPQTFPSANDPRISAERWLLRTAVEWPDQLTPEQLKELIRLG